MGETHVNEEKSLTELMGTEETTQNEHHSIDRLQGIRKKTDLSDIILEKENSTTARNKKIILGAASLVLLFLIFLIISKMLNSNINTQEQTDKQVNKNIKTDAPTEIAKINETKKEPEKTIEEDKNTQDKEIKKSPEVKDTDMKFEEMVKKLREEDAKGGNNEVVKVVTPPKIKKTKTINTSTKPIIKKVENKPKKEQKVIITDAKKTNFSKTTKLQKPIKNIIFGQNSGYYIQVGATTIPNPNKFLSSKIKNSGYSYITHPIVVKGRKFYKVLIGPYNSKAEAVNKLPRVKATINPKAFLYHLR
jgi:DedD protein